MRLGALAGRSLAARPLRTLLTIFGVALGVAIVAATLLANQASSDALERAAQELFGRAELRVRAFNDEGFTPRTVTALRRIPGVLNAAAVAEQTGLGVYTAAGPNEQIFTLLAIGVDPADETRIRDWDLADGAFLDPAQPAGVLVTVSWAREHDLGVGDEILVNGRLPEASVNRIVGILNPSGFGALASGNVMVFQRDYLNSARAVPTPTRYVDLQVAPGREADVQEAVSAELTEPFVVETAADAKVQLARAQAGFAGLAFLFGMVALGVGAFGVANTVAMTVSDRLREFGLLRAAGTTARQVIGLLLREGAVLAVAGSLLGTLLGVAAATLMIAFLRSTRALLIEGVPWNPVSLGLAALIGIAVTLGAALVPAIAAARISPLDALRPVRQTGRSLVGTLRWMVVFVAAAVLVGAIAYPIDRGDASPLGALLAVAILLAGVILVSALLQPLARVLGRPFEIFFGAEGMLGRANLGRHRVRTGLTVGALLIGLASVVALGGVSASARASADRWVGSILPSNEVFRGSGWDAQEPPTDLLAIDEISSVSPIVEFPAVIAGETSPTEVSMAGIDPTDYQDQGALIFVVGDRATAFQALRTGGAVLVPDGMARREGYRVGSQLPLATPGGEIHNFRVAGVVAYTLPARSPDGALLVSLPDARDQFGASTAKLWALIPRPDAQLGAFRASAETASRNLAGELLTTQQLADALGRGLDRLIGLFDVLALLTVLIGGLGIVNTLAVGVTERSREIAILRSHGMTVGQVQAMVVSEATILGAVGGVTAAAAGLLVAWVTVAFGAPGDFGAGLSVPWLPMVVVVLLGIGVSALAGIYPARRAAATPITGELRHFE